MVEEERWAALVDATGLPWCAQCFDYITRHQEKQEHHPIGEPTRQLLFSDSRLTRGWTVPAHANPCHVPLLQHPTDTANERIRPGEWPKTFLEAALLQKRAFLFGHLNLALGVNIATRTGRLGINIDGYERRRQLIHDLNATAGIAYAQVNFNSHEIGRPVRSVAEKDGTFRAVDETIYRGTVLWNTGQFKDAKERIDDAANSMPSKRVVYGLPRKSERYRETHRLMNKIARVRSLTFMQFEKSLEAVRMAYDDEDYFYSVRTASVGLVSSLIREGKLGRAVDELRRVDSLGDGAPVSWWHIGMNELLHAAVLRRGVGRDRSEAATRQRIERLYLASVTSQYVFAMLGLRATPIQSPWHRAFRPMLIAPVEIIVESMLEFPIYLKPKRLVELRKSRLPEIRDRIRDDFVFHLWASDHRRRAPMATFRIG